MTDAPSRLRRARRVFVGGLVGGAVVMLDRRRRRREPVLPRGGDPLAPFTSAPCYREGGPPPGGAKSG